MAAAGVVEDSGWNEVSAELKRFPGGGKLDECDDIESIELTDVVL